jgi:hypothetical protein
VHIAGDRPLRFPFHSLALASALVASLCPRPLHAQALTDLPDPAPSVEAAPPAMVISTPPPAPAPPPAATASGDTITAQVGTRAALRVQNPNVNARDKLNDVGMEGEADVMFWGQVHPFLKWQAGFVGAFGPPTSSTSAALLDLVAKLEFAESVNLWVGRMPMASDRASLSTVWAIAPWTMPGRYDAFAPTTGTAARPTPGPRQGDNQRGDGATLWGQLGGGMLKYYVGIFGLGQPETSPLYTARLVLNLLNPEPGFRTSSAYFGTKDILALGVGAQHRAGDSRPPLNDTYPASDFNEFNADLLFENGSPTAGVLDLESSIARMWGDNEVAKYQVVALVSYLMPIDIGYGRLQPLVRFQRAAHGQALDAGDFASIEAQLGYIIDGFHARLLAVYQYAKVKDQVENSILLGVQLLSHAK